MLSPLCTSNICPPIVNTHQMDKILIQCRNPNNAPVQIFGAPGQSGIIGVGTSFPLSQLSNTSSFGAMVGVNATGISWKSTANEYACALWGAPASGNSFGLRINTTGTTSSDYPLYVSSGSSGATAILSARGDGTVGVGTTTPSARLHTLSTTEQLRVGYDTSNYMSVTTGSAGSTTFALIGTSPGFTFTAGSSSYTASSAGLFISPSSVRSYLNGSDSIGSGANFMLGNTGATVAWMQQLSASNHLDWWTLASSTWTARHRFMATGAVGFGIGQATPLGALEARGTTSPQFVVSYDATHYMSIGVNSAGTVNFNNTSTAPGYNFNNTYASLTGFCIDASCSTTCTTSGTNFNIALEADITNASITTGQTESGYRIAVRGEAYASTTGFAGTLTTQYGVQGRAGISSATSGAIVSNAAALVGEVLNSVSGCTISNSYGLYITNTDATGTTTNRYGIYVNPTATGINYLNGLLGIQTVSPQATLDIRGATLNYNLGSSAVGHYRTVASFNTVSPSQTGTIKIKLPNYGNATMMQVKINGYDYSTCGAFEILIGGYNYTNHTWINTSVAINGRLPFSSIRLANDGANDCILLGITSTVLQYPSYTVSELIASYSNQLTWGSGYTITQITSETGIVNITTLTPDIFTDSSGNTAFGGSLAPLGQVESRTTSEANFISSYDATHYMSVTTASTGSTTFALTGTSPTFSFSQAVSMTGNLSVTGNITATGTVTSSSDAKLKKNIITLTNALDKVNLLRGVEFDRVDIEERQIGLIAQEVEEILPMVVSEQNGIKAIAYGNLVAILVEAVKEQSKRIQILEDKLGV
jgi:hypothetical protein